MIYDLSCCVIKDTQPFGFSDGYRGWVSGSFGTHCGLRTSSSWFLAWSPVRLAWCVVSEDQALSWVLEDTQPSEAFGGSHDQTSHYPVVTRNQVAGGPLACGPVRSSACADNILSCILGPLGAFAVKPRKFPTSFYPSSPSPHLLNHRKLLWHSFKIW